MDIHVCKQCGLQFAYCRACVFKPLYYKDLGFCSKECYIASKNQKIEEIIHEDVEVVVIEEDTSTSKEEIVEYPYFFAQTSDDTVVEEVKATPKKKKNKNIKKENIINDNEQSDPQNI